MTGCISANKVKNTSELFMLDEFIWKLFLLMSCGWIDFEEKREGKHIHDEFLNVTYNVDI